MTKSKWNVGDIGDQTGRVVIVTGANSGIGFETARVLAQKGAQVIMACRNMQKANPKADEIRADEPAGTVEVLPLDLSDLDSVAEFSEVFKRRFKRLDLLINNAGIMMPPYGKTSQGFESQFGVNHLGHFALTMRLLSLLNSTDGARVVTVSSMAHKWGGIQFDDLNWEQKYKAAAAYGQSKLANLLFTYELQRKLKAAGSGTIATAAHPGWTATNLQDGSRLFKLGNRFFAQKPLAGALPTLRAAVEAGLQGGEYFGPSGLGEMTGAPKRVESNKQSHDGAVASRLWEVSEQLTGLSFS